MRYSLADSVRIYTSRYRFRKIFRKLVRVLGCIVAFVTTYALILPAITMEKPTFCGLEEHIHGETCTLAQYRQVSLICDPAAGVHIHEEGCYDEAGRNVCGQCDYVVHSHADSCYDPEGTLLCTLPERRQHSHAETCYEIPEPVPHVHGEGCITSVKGELICLTAEEEGHSHGESCYQLSETLECTKEENHLHTEGCCTRDLMCQQTQDHVHEDSCYSPEPRLTCTLEENHSHSTDCYQKDLTCLIPETPGHSHQDACFQWSEELTCGLEEGTPVEQAPVLVCAEPEAPVHIHSEACMQYTLVEAEPICAQDHDHTQDCYLWSCKAQEHTHSLPCYSDPQADVETREYWESTLAGVELTGNWNEDVLAVARSQLGYRESTRNYAVWEDGTTHGYTRYGAWYGIPHGDWCGMFASFCLEYAGVEGMPYHYGVRPWIELLSEPQRDLYETAQSYTPIGGDLVFFDWEGDGLSDHVGIVSRILPPEGDTTAKLETIEGNSSNMVQYVTYDLDDPRLLGYSRLPEKTREEAEEPVYYCGLEIHSHEEGCYDEAGELTCQLQEHQHEDTCLIQQTAYYCGLEVHSHEAGCYDEAGELTCQLQEHQHEDTCLTPPPTYYCGLEVHSHEAGCYDEAGELTCEKEEHLHTEECLDDLYGYFCGIREHTHDAACQDEAGEPVCQLEEHRHTSLCRADLAGLDEYQREMVIQVITMIDQIPSADEIDEKILAFEEAEDYEGEELWLTEVYQNVALAYAGYITLDEPLQQKVVNRDKLLELEYIWSIMPLATYYVWLDGTNGDMMSLMGAGEEVRTLTTAGTNPYSFTLPTSWEGPDKYAYTLRGWYDIYSRRYYAPGDTVTISQNTVFYADWEAETYNVGQFDAHVVDTVSTSEFVTIRMFDYSGIFNMYSSRLSSSSLNRSGHSETWSAVSRGSDLSDGSDSLGIILRDWDSGGPRQSSWPSNWSDGSQAHNTSQDTVTFGLYHQYGMYDVFFNPNSSYLGKEYLGTADHLFQYEKDPGSEYYGYYYYDSARNAASYNQGAGRFYVYDYLERTTTSRDNGKDSDFLPFNSPYVNNPDGYAPVTSTSGSGQRIYTFDSTDGNGGMTGTNFWFGMTTQIRFYLPSVPGTRDESGEYGNQSIYGKQMEFNFSGDDDVFVLVDNQLILDIGGMHDIKSGTINFSTGLVHVEGTEQTDKTNLVRNLQPGEHTLTLLYMERGSSMSNCSIYFNISPRFTLSLQKEDLLSNELLSGAQFQVFMDEACQIPATLWSSHEAYLASSRDTTNTLTVTDGSNSIWGFAAGNTYYIKETKPPDKLGYLLPNGLIKMELSNKGVASYTAMVIPDPNSTGEDADPTPGFRVEGFRIDEENHVAYLIVNNTIMEGEITEVMVQKAWEGTYTTPVTVYLLADGQRIQEVTLSDENNWQHLWENLPKYETITTTDPEGTSQREIVYTVEEGVIPGYVGSTEIFTEKPGTAAQWTYANNFAVNETFLLQSGSGYLATTASGGLAWVSEADAKASSSAHWRVESYNGRSISLKNEAGFYLCNHWLGYGDGESYFYGSTDPATVMFNDYRFYESENYQRYMHLSIDANGRAYTRYDGYNAARFTLYQRTSQQTTQPLNGQGFRITNRPIPPENQTSVTVTKRWSERDGTTAFADQSLYLELNVPVKLQANGEDTGQNAYLSFRNQWKHTFPGLPKKDAAGNTIAYTVVEDWDDPHWRAEYDEVIQNQDGTYTVRINNVYDYKVEIPVEKHWDPYIHPDEMAPVQILLYSAPDDNMDAVFLQSITVSEQTQWKGSFQVIPPEEAGMQYYVYESTDRFSPAYGEPAMIFIDGTARKVSRVTFDPESGAVQTAVVTNLPFIELPETGGAGTLAYHTGGLLLVLAALLLLAKPVLIRRREEQ